MRPVLSQALPAAFRHRLQTLVVLVISVLAISVGAMGGTLLVQTSSPYDRVFADLAGPQVIVTFDSKLVQGVDVAKTASLPGVTAASGPWAVSTLPFARHSSKFGLELIGRDDPGGRLHRVALVQGHWAHSPGEVVLTRSFAIGHKLSIGDQVNSLETSSKPALTVVGEALDVNPDPNRAWVNSQSLAQLIAADTPLRYQMAYRFGSATTREQINARVAALEAALPAGAIVTYSSYFDFRDRYNFNNSLVLTFLLAFAALALGAVIVIVVNVVSGAVLASYRNIGILKAIGFTPRQVVSVLVLQMTLPAAAAALIGVPLGALASKPLLDMSADAMGLPPPSPVVPAVDVLAFVVALALVAAAAALPAWRAGRIDAVAALTAGTAPSGRWSTSLHGRLGWWRLPRSLAVGAGDAFARPLRGGLTAVAILVGVATLVFASGLYTAILKFNDLFISTNYQVAVSRFGGYSDAATLDLLQQQPDTNLVVGQRQAAATLPNELQPLPATFFRGASDRLGVRLADGRWFSGPGEVVITVVFNPYHWRVGQTIQVLVQGTPLTLRVSGICFCFFALAMDWSTLAGVEPTAQPSNYLVQLHRGANAHAYVNRISAAQPDFIAAQVVDVNGGFNTEDILNALVASLAAILAAIAGLGVFNTLLLTTRERVRDIAVLKALGMTPGQVSAMVMTSAGVLGVIGVLLGIPAGIALYNYLIDAMARVAGFTISSSTFGVAINPLELGGVGIAGILVALAGAILPARWAARTPVASILNLE